MAWITPKTNWDSVPKNPKAEDFNRVEGNIDFLKTDIETKKGLIVDAVNNIGGNSQVTDTHVQIAAELNSLLLTGDAAASEVLSGKTFYSNNPKNKITGTMPTKAAATITPGTANQSIAAGQYLTGTQTIAGSSNLLAANIKSGVNIFGVNGSAISIDSVKTMVITGTGSGTTTHTIASTPMGSSIVLLTGFSTPSFYTYSYADVRMLSNTSVEFGKLVNYSTTPWEATFLIISFSPSSVKSIQRGISARVRTSDPDLNITIASVNVSKSVAVFNRRYSATSSTTDATGVLTSSTNLRVSSGGTFYRPDSNWFVLELN